MEDRVYMRAVAKELDRSSGTIRGWERDSLLPTALLSHRDEKDWRYWTRDQVEQIKLWMVRNGMAPGKGLAGFQPDSDQVKGMLQQLRQPRDIEREACPHCDQSFKNLAAHVRLAHPEAA